MKLVIAEKDSAAERIADILSNGEYSEKKISGISIYEWGDMACVGLAGHVVEIDFEESYRDWNAVEPSELIDADIVQQVGKEDIVEAVRKVAEKADEVIIATDYDTEGELIGKEACEISGESFEDVQRARFSSLTPQEIETAFSNPENLDIDLASAGEARREIDLLWGASLTRYLSLASGRLGDSFISVGRVQSPTLKLLVDREKEREQFDPESYWEIYAYFEKEKKDFESKYFYREEGRKKKRIWEEKKANDIFEKIKNSKGSVEKIESKTTKDNPPIPFNTTQFIRAAGSMGFSASGAMSIAENLYTSGYISYPRTDNTVYPDELEIDSILKKISDKFKKETSKLLDKDLQPTSGDKETSDHPPIHPTSLASEEDLSDAEWKIYELIVRRFFATLANSAKWKKNRAVIKIQDENFEARGRKLIKKGYHFYYPYFSTNESKFPKLEEGEVLAVKDSKLKEGETNPPSRISQSKLVKKMEDLGLGTKCLSKNTDILKYNQNTGKVESISVEDLFQSQQFLIPDGDQIIEVSPEKENSKVFCLDELTGEISEREISLITKRKLKKDEQMIQINTEFSSFRVTDDHPVYVYNNDRIEIKPASQISSGDFLITTQNKNSIRNETDKTAIRYTDFKKQINDLESLKLKSINTDEILPIRWNEKFIGILADFICKNSLFYKDSSTFIEEISSSDFKSVFGITKKIDNFVDPKISDFIVNILEIASSKIEEIPNDLQLLFLGNIFEKKGYIEEGKICISDIKYSHLKKIKQIYDSFSIESKLYESNSLFIEERYSIENFLDNVPIFSEEDYHTLLLSLQEKKETRKKSEILNLLSENPLSKKKIQESLPFNSISRAIEELKDQNYIRNQDESDAKLYMNSNFRDSVYASISNIPCSIEVTGVEKIEYDDYVYDLTIDRTAPNFAIDNGVIVHNSTRHETIRKLYNRGYIDGNPPRPTALARSVVKAMENSAKDITDPEMTRELEKEMKNIAEGEEKKEEVVESSRESLSDVFDSLKGKEEEVGDIVLEGLKQDRTLGKCPECGGNLVIRNSKNGFFVGCNSYPDCKNTYPLPSDNPVLVEDKCKEHELRKIKTKKSFYGCPICKEEEAGDKQYLGKCPECGEKQGGKLMVKRTKKGGRLAGCSRYPDCDYSLPLPGKGNLEVDGKCDEHGLKKLTINESWDLGCPICNYENYKENKQ